MSAIFGIIDFEGRPIETAWIKSMQDDLAHRGPDRQDLYREESMFLGHMLLKVTPESIYDTSPYEEDGFVITANARLDEREAIMDRLGTPQEERTNITDPLLLLRSFIKYGENFVKDIYGDFAFAIWDKDKKELFCARDQMGVKPFFYYFQDGRLVFSTEMKAIVKLEIVQVSIDNIYLRDHALGIYNKVENTIWKNINPLGKACKLSLKKKKSVINQYWFPKYKRNRSFKTEEDSSAELLRILKRVIADHTRTIGDVGADLSGGLDSSSIVCLASKHLSEQNKFITTVSSVYEPEYSNAENPDEKEYIDEVIRNVSNIHPHFVYRSDHNFWRGLRKKYKKTFTPVFFFYYVQDAIFNKYKEMNVRRVLNGHPGDSTISNTTINPFTILLCSGKMIRLFKLIRLAWDRKNQSFIQFVKNNILIDLIPLNLNKIYFKLRGKELYEYDDISHFPYKFNETEKYRIKKELINQNSQSSLTEKHILQHIWPRNHTVIPEETNCSASHYNIEMTFPFADRRLIEFLLQIPVEHFYAKGFNRGLIRLTLKDLLPQKIVARKNKGDFSPGHVEIFKKDVVEICEFLTKTKFNFDIKNSIDSKKLIKALKNLRLIDENYIFTFQTWCLFNLAQLFYFNNFYQNNIMKEIKLKTWDKPTIKKELALKNTLGNPTGQRGDGIGQSKRS